MFSKPVGTILLVLGCLTAAGGGAYIATRHNNADTATFAPHAATQAPDAVAAAPAPAQPVAETEAVVTSPKAESEPAAATSKDAARATPAEAPAPAPSRRSEPAARRDTREVTPAKPAPPRTVHDEAPAKAPAQRTVPMTGTPAAPANDATAVGQAMPSAASNAPAPRPAEAMRPADPPPSEPRAPQYEELILPAASVIGLQVESSTNTERARVEDRVDARVSRDVMAGGHVAIPAGSRVIGSVTEVDRGGKVKEQARLGIRFHTLVLGDGTQVQLHTDTVYRLGEAPAASSTKKIGGAAIGGAILGAILGGGKGAAIGGATGAAGGTAAVMAGDRNPAALRQGEYLNVKLSSPATITVERHE
jgi:hypothetical protein